MYVSKISCDVFGKTILGTKQGLNKAYDWLFLQSAPSHIFDSWEGEKQTNSNSSKP